MFNIALDLYKHRIAIFIMYDTIYTFHILIRYRRHQNKSSELDLKFTDLSLGAQYSVIERHWRSEVLALKPYSFLT